ncbi:MAG: bifunctional pyr operon transcriptional regulator/uracil phosphoribosyltransferase, partial [Dehalococcoidia bacterium]
MSSRRILTQDDIRRVLSRMAHEILERNRGAKELLLVGIRTRGVPIAR